MDIVMYLNATVVKTNVKMTERRSPTLDAGSANIEKEKVPTNDMMNMTFHMTKFALRATVKAKYALQYCTPYYLL